MNFWEIQKQNKRKTLQIIIVLIIILCIIGYTVDYQFNDFYDFPFMTIVALIFGIGQSFWAYYWGDKAIIASSGARPLDFDELREKQLYNIVEEMTLASGIPMPDVYIVDEGGPNAFATGRDPMHASVAVTRELLNIMNREEIQGVVAHEIAHIRNRDTLTLTVTVALGGSILLLSDMARRMMYHGGGRSRDSRGGGIVAIIGIVLIILAPIIVRLLSMAVSRSREYAADAGGVEFTRNPMGLANALQKIDDYYTGRLDLSKFNREAQEKEEKSKHLSSSPFDPLQLPVPVPPVGSPTGPLQQNLAGGGGSKLTPEQPSSGASIDAMMQSYSDKDKYQKISDMGHSFTGTNHAAQNMHPGGAQHNLAGESSAISKLTPEQNAAVDAMMQAYSDKSKYQQMTNIGNHLTADVEHNVDINTVFSDYSDTHEATEIDKEKYGIASLFIYNPLNGELEKHEDWWSNLWSTHPPIQQRISILTGKAKLMGAMKKR